MTRLLSVKEYALVMGVNPETVRVWIRARRIHALRIGPKGRYRIQHRVEPSNCVSSHEANSRAHS